MVDTVPGGGGIRLLSMNEAEALYRRTQAEQAKKQHRRSQDNAVNAEKRHHRT